MFMQIWLILCKKTLNVVTLDCATAFDWLILFLSIDWLFIVTEVTRVLLSLFLWFTKSDKNCPPGIPEFK